MTPRVFILVVALSGLLMGCEFTAPPLRLENGDEPPTFSIRPHTSQDEIAVRKLEIRSDANAVLWRIEATPAARASEFTIRYGTPPSGFVQTAPPVGVPPPLSTVTASSVIVYFPDASNYVLLLRSRAGAVIVDDTPGAYQQPYAKP